MRKPRAGGASLGTGGRPDSDRNLVALRPRGCRRRRLLGRQFRRLGLPRFGALLGFAQLLRAKLLEPTRGFVAHTMTPFAARSIEPVEGFARGCESMLRPRRGWI